LRQLIVEKTFLIHSADFILIILFADRMEYNRSIKLVMERYKIEQRFKNSLVELNEMQLNAEFISAVIRLFEEEDCLSSDEFSKFGLGEIIDYIRKSHRLYILKKLPEIEQSIMLLLENFDSQHPLLLLLRNFLANYQKKLMEHIACEEGQLLPHIAYLRKLKADKIDLEEFFYRTKNYSIRHFMDDHDNVEKDLRTVRNAILSYDPPETNVTPYRILLSQLELFEKDLNVHAFIEDYILLPRMLQIENYLQEEFIKKIKLN
jgi:regulator of cell morphogenesis and NO signaling